MHELYHEPFTGLWILSLGMYLHYLDTENKLWKKPAHRELLSESNPPPLVPTLNPQPANNLPSVSAHPSCLKSSLGSITPNQPTLVQYTVRQIQKKKKENDVQNKTETGAALGSKWGHTWRPKLGQCLGVYLFQLYREYNYCERTSHQPRKPRRQAPGL